jgi:hypothetical protein
MHAYMRDYQYQHPHVHMYTPTVHVTTNRVVREAAAHLLWKVMLLNMADRNPVQLNVASVTLAITTPPTMGTSVSRTCRAQRERDHRTRVWVSRAAAKALQTGTYPGRTRVGSRM